MAVPTPGIDRENRRGAFLSILPFLALGLIDVLLLLFWGINPLWGFVILPPILFICVLGWIAFTTGFADRKGLTESDD